MKKITILVSDLSFGGIEKYVSNFCKMFEKNFNIQIISIYKTQDKPLFDFSKKIKIEYLINDKSRNDSLKKHLFKFKIVSFFKELRHRIKVCLKVKKTIKKKLLNLKSDYIITTRIKHHNLVDKYVSNITKIATEHNYPNTKYIYKLNNAILNYDYLIVPTKELYNKYEKIMNPKCIYIQNHIDEISNEKSPLKEKNIISVGRFSTEKGFLDLIDVFKIINEKQKNIKLFLLGDGYLREKIEEKIKEYKLEKNIILPGFIKEQKKYYLQSSLYVMTSFTEAFGLVLLESMSYGVPLIAFNSASGAREIITKDIGVLIKNRNKEEMANKIIELLNNEKKLKEYQKNIAKVITKYTEKEVKEKWLKILK